MKVAELTRLMESVLIVPLMSVSPFLCSTFRQYTGKLSKGEPTWPIQHRYWYVSGLKQDNTEGTHLSEGVLGNCITKYFFYPQY